MNDQLPSFPVDDFTLAAVEHALGACLTYESESGEALESPRVVGAEYTLSTLLDFMSGTLDDDSPQVRVLETYWDGSPRVVVDERQHYHHNDVIRALVAEVRALRAAGEGS